MALFEIMITLGGSPIAVAVPPILENNTSAIRIFRGSKFNTSQSLKCNHYIGYVRVKGPSSNCKKKKKKKKKNAQIQIILQSGPLLLIHTLCRIQSVCQRTVKTLFRLRGCSPHKSHFRMARPIFEQKQGNDPQCSKIAVNRASFACLHVPWLIRSRF